MKHVVTIRESQAPIAIFEAIQAHGAVHPGSSGQSGVVFEPRQAPLEFLRGIPGGGGGEGVNGELGIGTSAEAVAMEDAAGEEEVDDGDGGDSEEEEEEGDDEDHDDGFEEERE